jgi:2-methylcitrate dehydratase PrpD
MDLLRSLIDHVLETEYRSLPPGAIAAAKRSLLDTLGTLLAGSGLKEYDGLLDLVQGWGGKEESSLVPWGRKVPFPDAVLVNATFARARDFDEVHPVTGIHPSASVIPTALALAERMGGISGREFLAAVALGIDVLCRMRMADNKTAGLNGWSSDTYNPFGAAFTAGRLLRLNGKEMSDALGFAYAQAAGGYQIFQEPGYSAVYQGLGARAGAFAALLAQKGMSGPADSLEGKYGLYHLYLQGDYDPRKALARLGEEFQGEKLTLKAYPCCLFTHGPVETLKEVLQKNQIQPGAISQVIVKTNRSAYNLCCEPRPERYRPSSRRSAMFSIPYALGSYLVKGRVFFEEFLEENIRDEKVLEMASKVTPQIDPILDELGISASPTMVEVVLSSGQKYSARVDYIKGHPQNPMDFEGCVAKFKQCATYSARPISDETLEGVIDLVNHLEGIEDVRSIVGRLIG